jgi:hypothetical protein
VKDFIMTLSKASLALGIAGLLAYAPSAQAFNVAPPTRVQADGVGTTLVRYRGHHHHHGWRHRHRHHHHFGRDLAIGLGLGLLGSAIASQPSGYYYSDARSRCAARFRSFEWNTGLYTTYGGDKRLCPYLR